MARKKGIKAYLKRNKGGAIIGSLIGLIPLITIFLPESQPQPSLRVISEFVGFPSEFIIGIFCSGGEVGTGCILLILLLLPIIYGIIGAYISSLIKRNK